MAHDINKCVMLRNKIVKILRKAKADLFYYLSQLLNSLMETHKLLKTDKKITGQNNIETRPVELKINGTILQSPINVAQALNHFYWISG